MFFPKYKSAIIYIIKQKRLIVLQQTEKSYFFLLFTTKLDIKGELVPYYGNKSLSTVYKLVLIDNNIL